MAAFKEISVSRINSLDSRLVASAMRVYEKCTKSRIPLYIIWGRRTDEEQELLYRHGRSIPGRIITSRRGGFSPHNYGLALDFCLLFETDLLTWEDCYPHDYWRWKWIKAIKHFEAEGWDTGWRWSSFEPGHVENLLGKTIGELKNEREQAENRGLWIENLRRSSNDQEFFI